MAEAAYLDKIRDLGTTSKPRLAFTGDLVKNVNATLYIVDKQIRFENPIEAVAACLDYYIAINIEYQPGIEPVWIFLQKLCNVFYNNQVLCPTVETLINHIKLKLK